MNNKSLLITLLVPSAVIMIPLMAMLAKADGWAWTMADFVFAWVIIAGALVCYQLLTRKAEARSYRGAAALAVVGGLLLIWINGAVGIIGSENNPANLMYGGVLAVGVMGTLVARLKPSGMAWALFAAALAQFMVPVLALIMSKTEVSPGVAQVFGLNTVFVLLFAGSGLLFNRAARQSCPNQSMPWA